MESRTGGVALRLIGLAVWLSCLLALGSAVLLLAGSRIGERQESSYGQAYRDFQGSWGGVIDVTPPRFHLQRSWVEPELNAIVEDWVDVDKTETLPLLPQDIQLTTDLRYGERRQGWLRFRAFEAQSVDRYLVHGHPDHGGRLFVELTLPEQASILHSYTITLPGRRDEALRPAIGQPFVLLEDLEPGEIVPVEIRYTTKGMDRWRYLLSRDRFQVQPSFGATVTVDTPSFQLWRVGLPHTLERSADGASIRVDLEDFTTAQDLGVSFRAVGQSLGQVQQLVMSGPVSLGLLLAVVFVFGQTWGLRFSAFHYLFLATIDVFYFLFVTYLVRFASPLPTFGLALALTLCMFLIYFPRVLGRRLAFAVALPALIVLTAGLSLVFLLPVFRGLTFLALVFGVFMVVMAAIGRSDLSRWPLVLGPGAPSDPS